MTPIALEDAVAQTRLLRGQLSPGERIVLSVRSGSMAPIMPVGSRIAVEAVAGHRCDVGDIVVFARDQRLVAHRLLLTWPVGPDRWFLERGDGISGTGLLHHRAVLGRVVTIHHPAGNTTALASPAARWQARRAVRKSLRNMVRGSLAALARRVTTWRSPTHTASG